MAMWPHKSYDVFLGEAPQGCQAWSKSLAEMLVQRGVRAFLAAHCPLAISDLIKGQDVYKSILSATPAFVLLVDAAIAADMQQEMAGANTPALAEYAAAVQSGKRVCLCVLEDVEVDSTCIHRLQNIYVLKLQSGWEDKLHRWVTDGFDNGCVNLIEGGKSIIVHKTVKDMFSKSVGLLEYPDVKKWLVNVQEPVSWSSSSNLCLMLSRAVALAEFHHLLPFVHNNDCHSLVNTRAFIQRLYLNNKDLMPGWKMAPMGFFTLPLIDQRSDNSTFLLRVHLFHRGTTAANPTNSIHNHRDGGRSWVLQGTMGDDQWEVPALRKYTLDIPRHKGAVENGDKPITQNSCSYKVLRRFVKDAAGKEAAFGERCQSQMFAQELQETGETLQLHKVNSETNYYRQGDTYFVPADNAHRTDFASPGAATLFLFDSETGRVPVENMYILPERVEEQINNLTGTKHDFHPIGGEHKVLQALEEFHNFFFSTSTAALHTGEGLGFSVNTLKTLKDELWWYTDESGRVPREIFAQVFDPSMVQRLPPLIRANKFLQWLDNNPEDLNGLWTQPSSGQVLTFCGETVHSSLGWVATVRSEGPSDLEPRIFTIETEHGDRYRLWRRLDGALIRDSDTKDTVEFVCQTDAVLKTIQLSPCEARHDSELAALLRWKSIILVKGRYFEDCNKRGVPLQRRQDIPEEYVWDAEAALPLWKVHGRLFLLNVSHCWLDGDHPDPNCFNLKRLSGIIQKLKRYASKWGVEEIAVCIDFCSLWQAECGQLPSHEKRVQFDAGMKGLIKMFAHQHVASLRLTSVPMSTRRLYEDRGWTLCEDLLIDSKPGFGNKLTFCNHFDHEAETSEGLAFINKFGMKAPSLPLTPEAFHQRLVARDHACQVKQVPLFASSSDNVERICGLYRGAFLSIQHARCLSFAGAGWGDDQAARLCEVLEMCQTEYLCIAQNRIGDRGIRDLSNTLIKMGTVKGLELEDNAIDAEGALELARALPQLRHLAHVDLHNNPCCSNLEATTKLREAWLQAGKEPENLKV